MELTLNADVKPLGKKSLETGQWSKNLDLHRYLEGLYKIYLSSGSVTHAIRGAPSEKWREFTPSRFIYAFFTFNALYNLRWLELEVDPFLLPRSYFDLKGDKRLSEDEQIKSLIDFAFASSPTTAEEGWRAFRNVFEHQQLPADEVRRRLKGIKTSVAPRITKAEAGNAQKLVDILQDQATHPLVQLKGTVSFIYQVRCNVFHGRKTTVHHPDIEQCERFEVYTAVLLGVCAAAFDRAEKLHLWKNLSASRYL